MVDSIYKDALEKLANDIQRKFPAEAGGLFIPTKSGYRSHAIFPGSAELRLNSDNFLSLQRSPNGEIPVGIHNYDSLNRNNFETPGLDEILGGMGLTRGAVRTMADFRLPLGTSHVSGLIINPLSENNGFVTRQAADFNESAYTRIREFLAPHEVDLTRISGEDTQRIVATMERVFGTRIDFRENPVLPGYTSISYIQQAKGRFGGDIVHSSLYDEDAYYANGDVAGHDEEAHGLSHDVGVSLSTILQDPHSPNEALERLNRFVHSRRGEDGSGRFVIFSIAKFKPDGSFNFASAGDHSYIRRTDGSYEEIKSTGVPLGIADIPYGISQHRLNPGEEYLNLSDGFSEAGSNGRDDKVDGYGEERVFDSLNRGSTLREGIEFLCEDAHTHANKKGRPIGDDLSITRVLYSPQ